MLDRWLFSSSFQQLSQEGERKGRRKRARWKLKQEERGRMWWGDEKRDKQHVWTSNNHLTLFICCVVCTPVCHRSSVDLSEYIKTARKKEGEKEIVLLEKLCHQLSRSLSFIPQCVISFPHSVLLLSLHLPNLFLAFSLRRSRSISSQKPSWELGAKGRRLTRWKRFPASSAFSSSAVRK